MKILFVCLGNICRSPLAKGILKSKLKKSHPITEVDSAGFEAFHKGDPADARSVAVAADHGVDLSGHRARMFSTLDFDRFDRIYVMDKKNYQDVAKLARTVGDMDKVDYIMNLLSPEENKHIPDPWYGDSEEFEVVYQMLDEACDAMVRDIKSIKKAPKQKTE
jgi:protein-tyrosine phosphatase